MYYTFDLASNACQNQVSALFSVVRCLDNLPKLTYLSVPVKGQDEARLLIAERNVKNGQAWSALSDNERDVFTPDIFYALSGVPNPLLSLESDQDDPSVHEDRDGDSFIPIPQAQKLTLEEDQLYRPLYEALVDLQKVSTELGKPETGESVAKLQRKSATAIEKYAHQVRIFFSLFFFSNTDGTLFSSLLVKPTDSISHITFWRHPPSPRTTLPISHGSRSLQLTLKSPVGLTRRRALQPFLQRTRKATRSGTPWIRYTLKHQRSVFARSLASCSPVIKSRWRWLDA